MQMLNQAKVGSREMLVSCLHTLEANIEIFEAACPADISLMHHVRSELMTRSLEQDRAGLMEETAMHLRRLLPISDAVLLTSTILRDSVEPPLYHADLVLRDAVCKAATGHSVEVLVASPRVLPEVEKLYSNCCADATFTFDVVDQSWEAFQSGDMLKFNRLIADRIESSDAEIVVLAQTLMTTAAGRDPRVMTGPGVTLRKILDDHLT